MDGKKAAYKEVAKVLRGCGIDLDHNRFLILQVTRNLILSIHLSMTRIPKLFTEIVYHSENGCH